MDFHVLKALFGSFCVLVGATAVASGAAGEILEEALIAAYTSNPTLLAQRAALRATDEQVPQALSGWRPTVTVTGEMGKQLWETACDSSSSDDSRTL